MAQDNRTPEEKGADAARQVMARHAFLKNAGFLMQCAIDTFETRCAIADRASAGGRTVNGQKYGDALRQKVETTAPRVKETVGEAAPVA